MRLLLRILALPLLAGGLSAHERWVRHELLQPFDRGLFELANPATAAAWGAALLVFLLGLGFGRRRQPSPSRLRALGPALIARALGITLVVFAFEGCFLAPDLVVAPGPLGSALLAGACVVGALLTLGRSGAGMATALAAIFLVATVGAPILFEPFEGQPMCALDVLAYGGVLGMAAYLGLLGRAAEPGETRRSAAVASLRALVGANLAMLGLIKFLRPELFVGVVQNYPDVFAPMSGLSPAFVTLGASLVEVLVGSFLMVGVLPRPVAAGILGLFGTTGFLFHGEVLGHLPVLASAAALLLEGPAGRLGDVLVLAEERGLLARPSLRPVVARVLGAGAGSAVLFVVVLAASGREASGAVPPATGPGLDAGTRAARITGERGSQRFLVEVDQGAGALNAFFTVTTRVVDPASGLPLEPDAGLQLDVDVTMPAHGHGMLTLPVTEGVGRGLYETRGCKLHMVGAWEISLTLRRGESLIDRAALPLVLASAHEE